MQRRKLLEGLSITFGASFLLGGNELGVTAAAPQPMSVPATDVAVRDELAAGPQMEKVTGIGGFFFRAKDPVALGRWYQEHLGIPLAPKSYEDVVWQQEAGPTVFEAQPEDSDLFGNAHKAWMLNFRVRDLDKMAVQLKSAGIKVEIDPQTYPNGRFASLHDPEGNPIQLWQSKAPAAPH